MVFRTNAIKLRVKDKKGKHVDFISLYPTVQYYIYFSISHLEIILKPKELV